MKKISSPSLENLTLKSHHPQFPPQFSLVSFQFAISMWPKRWPAGSGGSLLLHHENSWNSSSKQHSLFPPFDYETRGNRWTNGRRSRGENGMRRKLRTCPRVRRAWPGRKSELPVRNSDPADQMRDEEFFLRSACSTRASRKLKFLFRLQIFVVSPRFTYPYIDREREREDRWLEFRIRVSRRDIGFIFFFLRGRGLFGIFVRVLAPSRNLFPLE